MEFTLKKYKELKYLGIIIDNHLQFNSHDYIAKKIAKKFNYKFIIAPYFKYCNIIMLNFSENSMNIMQKVQNRAMRAILRCNRYTSIRQMLDAVSFMTIKERIMYVV